MGTFQAVIGLPQHYQKGNSDVNTAPGKGEAPPRFIFGIKSPLPRLPTSSDLSFSPGVVTSPETYRYMATPNPGHRVPSRQSTNQH